jgi:YebC/PmpR family DNA-binding regulatory protein
MAGHSKWKQIKHYKAAADAKRGALFTKLIREITVAAKFGGGDPNGNPRLRSAIEAARNASMPKDNIERAIKKGTGELEGVEYQEITYEGYGPGGVALVIQALTDNPNRTVAEVRHRLSRGGGSLGSTNSVLWMFDRKGQIYVDATKYDEDATMEAALDAGAEDLKQDGEQFEITMAAKMGGGDPAGNPRLRTAIETARAASMPKENIERAIKKGTGELEGVDYQDVVYEGYGPGGVAIMIFALTDNPTRTVADVRHKLSRGGGNLGSTNSVAFMFDRKGQLYVDANAYGEDAALEKALEAGAEDFAREGDQYVITTEPNALHEVKSALEAAGVAVTEEEVAYIPKNTVQVAGETATQLLKLLESLEDLDDVQKVAANFEMDADEMAAA